MKLVAALGPLGFVFWLVWNNTHRTIPRLAKSFEQAIQEQRQDFRQILNEQREDFLREMEKDREVHARQLDRLTNAVEAVVGRVRERRRTDNERGEL